jgi:hypothetical protein
MKRQVVFWMFGWGVVLLGAAPMAAAPYSAEYWPSLGPVFTPIQKQLGEKAETFLNGITPGETVKVEVLVRNTGDLPWTTDAFFLSYHWDGPEDIWEGQRTMLPASVPPEARPRCRRHFRCRTLRGPTRFSGTWFTSSSPGSPG